VRKRGLVTKSGRFTWQKPKSGEQNRRSRHGEGWYSRKVLDRYCGLVTVWKTSLKKLKGRLLVSSSAHVAVRVLWFQSKELLKSGGLEMKERGEEEKSYAKDGDERRAFYCV